MSWDNKECPKCGNHVRLEDGTCFCCVMVSGAAAVALVRNNGERLRNAHKAKVFLEKRSFNEDEFQKEYVRLCKNAEIHEKRFPRIRVSGDHD